MVFHLNLHTYWRREWQPTPVVLPGESHGRRSLVGYSPRGCKESDMTERLNFHLHITITGIYIQPYRHNFFIIVSLNHMYIDNLLTTLNCLSWLCVCVCVCVCVSQFSPMSLLDQKHQWLTCKTCTWKLQCGFRNWMQKVHGFLMEMVTYMG